MRKKIFTLPVCILFASYCIGYGAEAPQAPVVGSGAQPATQQGSVPSGAISRISETKATITSVVGSVTIRSRGSLFWHDAKAGEQLSSGTEIMTKENGKIECVLENGNIIKLKPNSRLIISNITQNNLTGDYENFFQADTGQIWAKIKKIQGSSTFKIKTPTAIAGARGTIIYLVVFPDSTRVLFEEGRGFFVDNRLGQMFDTEPGHIYEIDNEGNFSGPVVPSSEQLQALVSGWEVGAEAEGYSTPPGGDTGDVEGDVEDEADDQDDSNEQAQDDKKNSQDSFFVDTDNDGIPDSTDTDDDNDLILDIYDAFPLDKTEWLDTDKDRIGNNADTDDDNDKVLDTDEVVRGTNILLIDTDDDGVKDDKEVNTDNEGLIDDYDLDDDNDTLLDTQEGPLGTGTNPLLTDTDLDGITDDKETNTDSEGLIDDYDLDDDNDEHLDVDDAFPLDKTEWLDTDKDRMGNNADPDDDNDGLSDNIEGQYGLDPLSNDSDGDGLTDGFEAFVYMDPLKADTDGDGILDAYEIKNGLNERGWDTDDDGAGDVEEMEEKTNPRLSDSFPHGVTYDKDLDGRPDKEDDDIDGDYLNNATEARYRFSYVDEEYILDPDGDITLNSYSADTDGGGISDSLEICMGSNPFDSSDDNPYEFGQDSDEDGIADEAELKLGLDPESEDTDDDGVEDQEELSRGTDPVNADTDNDGLTDKEEMDDKSGWHSDPLKADTDGDGATDKEEALAGTDPDHPLFFPEYVERESEGGTKKIYLDADKDGIPNGWDWDDDADGISDEMEVGSDEGEGEGVKFDTNPLLKDTDGDGIDDGIEIAEGTDPLDLNSFRAARAPESDKYVLDTDKDGISDQLEREIGLDPNNADTDSDGLNDGIEMTAQLNPFDKDTDGDGLEDGFEVFSEHLDPFSPDGDADGLRDNKELALGTSPNESDTDEDGIKDGMEVASWWVNSDPKDMDKDSDDDGIGDYEDAFPMDAERTKSRDGMREARLFLIEENELRREISDMLSDFSARYNDSVMERICDAQTGKVLIDREGYRVRVEQYILRPNANTVEVMNLTLRAGGDYAGLHGLDWKTTFNKSLDKLTGGQLRDLPWNDYLEGSIDENGRVTEGPNYGADKPEFYPVDMTVKMGNPSGDAFNEKREFGASLYQIADNWRQDITSDKMFVNNEWVTFTITVDQPSGTGYNPRGFLYNPDGLPSKWDVRARFYVIGDGDAGRVSDANFLNMNFNTIWDALAVNMAGFPDIGENNLEIYLQSKFGGNENRDIDLIYIPWERQGWRANHSWRGGETGAAYSKWRDWKGGEGPQY